MDDRNDGLQKIIDEALQSMAAECVGDFDPQACNLAEFCRRTGISRQRARTIKKNGFKARPHGRTGLRVVRTVLSGYTGTIDDLLRRGVTNSQVIFDRIAAQGYRGGLTTVKTYVAAHADLVPPRRRTAAPKGNRGRRFETGPGEAYQMDWGFVNVEDPEEGRTYRIACFAMVCHHCGTPYVEFFPNARQECLFIGMLHAFGALGVPDYVLTDNMKSVVTRRNSEGRPVWNGEYAAFMECVGFRTRLCKPRHPWTKGKSERLIRFVKNNFLAGRTFTDLTDLNEQAALWCAEQSGRYRRALACVPSDVHAAECAAHAHGLECADGAELYLCPRRRVTFDGFVSYEGRRFGVPWWYERRECRVSREGRYLHIYSDDLSRELAVHEVTWSRRDSWCEGQWADGVQPEELPTQAVTTTVAQVAPAQPGPGFERFDFGRMVM